MTQNSLIQTPFSFDSTAAEVVEGIDLSGKRAIVTGGSSGIGVETARALASVGAEVTLAVRDFGAGERTAAAIAAATDGPAVRVGALDLADVRSVSAFVAAWDGPLHLLINNAGVMALPSLQLTERGWELQFATNHIGHFALTVGLRQALFAGGEEGGARIVSLSSRGHLRSPVVFDDINFRARPYDAWTAYGQSKTANVLLAVEAHRRWAADGVTANAVHPGGILDTNLSRHMGPAVVAEPCGRADGDGGGASRRRADALQEPGAGRGDDRPRRHLAAAAGRRRPLLRGLQRGTAAGGRLRADRDRRGRNRTRSIPTTPRGCGSSRNA